VRVLASDPDSAAYKRASEPQRFAAAMRKAGGAAGEVLWQFPVPQHLARAGRAELLQTWNPSHGERAADDLLRQLVLAFRIWRPSVVVTDHPDLHVTGWPSDALLSEAVHEAFLRASDPKAFPEQLEQLGLEAWQVAKTYARWHNRADANVTLDLTDARPRLDTSARDFAAPAAALLADSATTLPNVRYYHLLDSRLAGAENHRYLLQGVDLAPGGVARRTQLDPVNLKPEVEKAVRTRRNLEALAETPSGPMSDPSRLLAQVGPMLAELPPDHGASAAFAIATHFAHLGQWNLAREVFQLLADRYPSHPLAVEGCRWLIRHYASSEARRRHQLKQFWIRGEETVRVGEKVDPQVAALLPGTKMPRIEAVGKRELGILTNPAETRRWYEKCLEVGAQLAANGPPVANDPATQFCLQSARRNLGDFEKARAWYARFLTEHPQGPWHDAAAAELWLLQRQGPPPKPVVYCRQTPTVPFLDGKFDDGCWQSGKPLVLGNSVGDTLKDYPTEVRFAYDKDFLYLALRCRHPADRHVPPVKVRPHDADLRPYDRVSLLLDLDRDYCSYFQLQVDQRGCVCDDCCLSDDGWGDLSWNPGWFVAVHSEKDTWQIEAAIPLCELTGESVGIGKAWACNVVRVIPGRGVQALSTPADVQPRPEGMGLLMFLPESRTTAASTPMTKVP
jgi:hypothetical protein